MLIVIVWFMFFQKGEKLAYLTKIGTVFYSKIFVKSSSSPDRPAQLDTDADDVTISGPSYRCGRRNSKNLISWIYTYIKGILHKLS